jgi:hypothetical protein
VEQCWKEVGTWRTCIQLTLRSDGCTDTSPCYVPACVHSGWREGRHGKNIKAHSIRTHYLSSPQQALHTLIHTQTRQKQPQQSKCTPHSSSVPSSPPWPLPTRPPSKSSATSRCLLAISASSSQLVRFKAVRDWALNAVLDTML